MKEALAGLLAALLLWTGLGGTPSGAQGESRTQVLDALEAGELDDLQAQASRVRRGLYGGQPAGGLTGRVGAKLEVI